MADIQDRPRQYAWGEGPHCVSSEKAVRATASRAAGRELEKWKSARNAARLKDGDSVNSGCDARIRHAQADQPDMLMSMPLTF